MGSVGSKCIRITVCDRSLQTLLFRICRLFFFRGNPVSTNFLGKTGGIQALSDFKSKTQLCKKLVYTCMSNLFAERLAGRNPGTDCVVS